MSETLERKLPSNPDVERSLLCCVMNESHDWEIVLDSLTSADFFEDRNRIIFQAMLELREEGNPPGDLWMLREKLVLKEQFEKVGGDSYLPAIPDAMWQVWHVEHYCKIVKDLSTKRKLIHQSQSLLDRAFDGFDSSGELIDLSTESSKELVKEAALIQQETVNLQNAGSNLLLSYESKAGPRIKSDVEQLDRLTGGFRGGELIIITADTGVGKTLFSQQVMRRACRDGFHSLYCSGEMSAPQLLARQLASDAGVEHYKMRADDKLTDADNRALMETASRGCTSCRILDGELSMSRIRIEARRMKTRGSLDAIMLDYDELIEVPGKNEFEQMRNVARGAKSLALEMGCPVILISQLRKILEKEDVKRPTLQRLYGSSAKAKFASIVIYVDREFVRELKGDETQARIAVLKNRDGKVGQFDAIFNVRTLRFEMPPAAAREEMRSWTGN